MNSQLVTYCAIIFVAALAGGIITIVRRWSDELLHLFVSFGAGVFLGVVFIHLLPEAFSSNHTGPVGFAVLLGFLLIFFVEQFLFTSGDRGYDHSHRVISITVLIGLSVHSLVAGFGLAITNHDPDLGRLIFYSIIAHKPAAAFSLGSLFLLARIPTIKALMLLALFAAMTPLGAMVLAPMFATGSQMAIDILTGLTAGSFLYVATSDLLPEVFHTKERRWVKLGLLLAGIAVIAFVGH